MGTQSNSLRAYYDTNKITILSVTLSIGVHLLAAVALKFGNLSEPTAVVSEDTYVDFAMQEFEEPPTIVPDVRQVEVKPDVQETTPAEPTPSVAHEMQDQGSDVAGVQKEAPVEPPKTTVVNTANVTDVPYYKVKPRYPKEALAQGLEGHVLLEIDILQDGSVENLKVVSGDKLNIFETEARRAVSKYKYKPFMDEAGNAIVKHNHLVKVDFKLIENNVN